MSLEAELKKFELSSVFTINFSWLKRYVESNNGMYTPMKNISDDEFREIENSLYALQATWKAWREAKAQAVPEGFVLVPMVPSERMINAVRQCYEGEAYLPYSLYSEFVNQAIIERMKAQE